MQGEVTSCSDLSFSNSFLDEKLRNISTLKVFIQIKTCGLHEPLSVEAENRGYYTSRMCKVAGSRDATKQGNCSEHCVHELKAISEPPTACSCWLGGSAHQK
jgi:hypothetical protein